MACGACGQHTNQPAPKYQVVFTTGETRTYLTMVEARVAVTAHGGGTITQT